MHVCMHVCVCVCVCVNRYYTEEILHLKNRYYT